MTTLSVNESIKSVQNSLDQVIQKTAGLSDEILRWNPAEEEWSIMQILCHLVEAVPYWLDEIEQLLEAPGKEWGRGLQHEGRLAAVSKEKVDSTSLSVVLKELEEVKPKVEKTLSKLNEEKLAMEAPSRNPRFGTKPISFIVDHLLVEHTEKHLGQIERNLSKANN
ncbi:DinB family protein [Bacillus taeanensis]|uniref:DinB family protein n=1 Tax=Bacillus taeanensis TaxID=273032 RepID=A0A366Y0Z3_9BACI|nr:DinB family protein [Bacillus taeanensis]RBW70084.1 DinB family protein [Bacillus taeanensis]